MNESFELHDLDDAQSFFELADEAAGPLVVTRDGERAFVVLRAADYERLARRVSELKEAAEAARQEAAARQVQVERALAASSPEAASTASSSASETSGVPSAAGSGAPAGGAHAVPYETASLPTTPIDAEDYQRSVWHDAITERMRKVMAAEAPIEKQRLFNRVRASFGIKRSGRDIQSHNEWLFGRNIEHAETRFNDAVFVWRPDQDPAAYHVYRPTDDEAMRQITEVPYEELACALEDALAGGRELSRDELIDAAMRLLGYKRRTNRVKEVVGAAIEQANHDGLLALTPAGTFRLAPPDPAAS